MHWALIILIAGSGDPQPINGTGDPFGIFPNASHCNMAGQAITARAGHLTWRCEVTA